MWSRTPKSAPNLFYLRVDCLLIISWRRCKFGRWGAVHQIPPPPYRRDRLVRVRIYVMDFTVALWANAHAKLLYAVVSKHFRQITKCGEIVTMRPTDVETRKLSKPGRVFILRLIVFLPIART
ncbi:hypothetical protein RSOL_284160 [Rhizoctonia solani AG-3 Rhs1AP]|uniref:Uncharacterized protein n=2 Tax=Rhizoctonia solani AG-3 TaxID=1086053 RepID=A0A074RPN4_9AGAM|nr:hypothetical protein RSOL_284160 [Rhizoctonia solani AG-3 Rhs1AP]KEP46638.1 hypothetical protein V565_188440 [Rhizoctonia solani 123E]